MRHAATLLASLLIGCAQQPGAVDERQNFLVNVPEGEVRVLADVTTYVFLTVVGAAGQQVTFSATNLPSFAALTGETIAITPGRSEAGAYEVAITATSGTASDTKMLHLVVEAPNRVPVGAMRPPLSDGTQDRRSISVDDASGMGCMLNPVLQDAVEDLDGDRVKIDLEVVPSGTAFAGVPTEATPWGVRGGWNGLYSTIQYELQGLAAGEEYDIDYRYHDEAGGLGAWRPLVRHLTCVPIGVRAPNLLEVHSGDSATFEFELLGVGTAPYTLSVTGLPPWATLSGTTLSVTAPSVTSVESFLLSVTLSSGGFDFKVNLETWLSIRP